MGSPYKEAALNPRQHPQLSKRVRFCPQSIQKRPLVVVRCKGMGVPWSANYISLEFLVPQRYTL